VPYVSLLKDRLYIYIYIYIYIHIYGQENFHEKRMCSFYTQ